MDYADVAIDADWIQPEQTFSYRIPRHLAVEPGQLVWVQFGRKYVQGIVSALPIGRRCPKKPRETSCIPSNPRPSLAPWGWSCRMDRAHLSLLPI